MSRNRLNPRISDNDQQMTNIWHGLVDTLRLLPSVPASQPSEKKTLDDAMDKLQVLIALKRGTSIPPDEVSLSVPGVTVSTPVGASVPGGAGGKRKRKSSYSSSPAPLPLPLPLSSGQGHGHRRNGSGTPVPIPNLIASGIRTDGSLESNLTSIPSPLPSSLAGGGAGGRSNTPNREMTGKYRRELYADQLPLQQGRKVAFKLPTKGKDPSSSAADDSNTSNNAAGGAGAGGGGGGGMTAGDDWILAVVKRCIQGDKMRYEVQDVDDDKIAYNTTLRSIIPLPDPTSPPHLSSHPSNLEDFPKDSQVLALYPDTTSFYRATVISPPIPGTGNGIPTSSSGRGVKAEPGAKKAVYRLVFVDDDENISEVHKDMVVAYPS